jgi:hypothetical protein
MADAYTSGKAVMESRSEAHDSLDDFPTPPWATRALMEHVILPILEETGGNEVRAKMRQLWTAREPCANRGYMVRPLEGYFRRVIASDIFDYGCGFEQADYLFPGPMEPAQFIIFNPPFRLAMQFINKAFDTPCWAGVAAFTRTSFLEGGDRYVRLFRDNPPTVVAHFVERVICTKGIVRDPSELYWDGGEWRRPSTATSYCWLYWQRGAPRRPSLWIPPCRRQLEKPGDYPPVRDAEGRRV